MNDDNDKPSGLILPAGLRADNSPQETYAAVVPARDGWRARIRAIGGAQEERLEIEAWAQVRRGEPSQILAEQLAVPGGTQVHMTFACPALVLEPMVFHGGGLVTLRKVLKDRAAELVAFERESGEL